jgi:hypothetical protein
MPQDTSLRLVLPGMILLLFPLPAFAYVDPGAGSMLLQTLLAGAAAILVLGQSVWQRVKSGLRRDKDTTRDSGS